ncbi:MAG TPA: cardiolipin synthase ClsB [Burkholderiaceae bacterium]|nr:cardiolipin synthase ClsB [Burkholderiaceae bacterium]
MNAERNTLLNTLDDGLTAFDTLSLLQGTKELFPALIEAIDAARHSIELETYIFDTTQSGADIAKSLAQAAARGVSVRLLVDGFGTPQLDAEWSLRFKQAGVHVLVFEPIVTFGFFIPSQWRRLHRKLCVIDKTLAFCGGINILDDFYDPNHGTLPAARFDFCVRVTGSLVPAIHQVTNQLWGQLAAHELGMRKIPERMLTALEKFKQKQAPRKFKSSLSSQKLKYADLVLRDNVSNRSAIERAYLQAIGEARRSIVIANAYFLPGAKLRKALINAAKRGVKVQLLLQGKYEYFLQYHAVRPVYGVLLAAGIEIYEYTPSYLHAKVAVVDGVWATVGSSNLDPLSLLLAREANIVVQDKVFANSLSERLCTAILQNSKRIEPSELANRPWAQRIRDRIAFAFMRTSLWFIGKRY